MVALQTCTNTNQNDNGDHVWCEGWGQESEASPESSSNHTGEITHSSYHHLTKHTLKGRRDKSGIKSLHIRKTRYQYKVLVQSSTLAKLSYKSWRLRHLFVKLLTGKHGCSLSKSVYLKNCITIFLNQQGLQITPLILIEITKFENKLI